MVCHRLVFLRDSNPDEFCRSCTSSFPCMVWRLLRWVLLIRFVRLQIFRVPHLKYKHQTYDTECFVQTLPYRYTRRAESRVWAFVRDSRAHQWSSKSKEPHPKGICLETPQEGVGNIQMVDWQIQLHHAAIAKIETALGCKLINIAKWDLQTKGKENFSTPCFLVCADYQNIPSVRLTAWIFFWWLILTSFFANASSLLASVDLTNKCVDSTSYTSIEGDT